MITTCVHDIICTQIHQLSLAIRGSRSQSTLFFIRKKIKGKKHHPVALLLIDDGYWTMKYGTQALEN
jgi:hypothetical protein